MAGSAELLCQFITSQPPGIEDQCGVGLPGFSCSNVIGAGAVTPFTPDSGHELVEMQLAPANRSS